ncbi:hypothetical protein [Nakamurella sp.]|uniref:hypothetical protein n=1 Tax=Nakamurella sp. TaxID=1869182 RepID=UPI003B3B8847
MVSSTSTHVTASRCPVAPDSNGTSAANPASRPAATAANCWTWPNVNVIGADGFALAGAGAIREHALTDRTTADVDLFGPPLTTVDQFAAIVRRAQDALTGADYTVDRLRIFDQFARLRVTNGRGQILDIDIALNWRSEPPVHLAIGPVLSGTRCRRRQAVSRVLPRRDLGLPRSGLHPVVRPVARRCAAGARTGTRRWIRYRHVHRAIVARRNLSAE